MIRKLRVQFVAVCMALVTAVMGILLYSLYRSVANSLESSAQQVLTRVIATPAGIARPGKPDGFTVEPGGGPVQMPYFTVAVLPAASLTPSDAAPAEVTPAFLIGGTYSNLEDTTELENIVSACLEQGEDQGTLKSYDLRYLRQDSVPFTKIAFVDMSIERAVLERQLSAHLQIGLVALVLLLGVSILLSRWLTRPVERAWTQQRQFLSDASHELKTPLTVILSSAELLEAAATEDRSARWVDNILSEGEQMKALVEEMLTLARSDDAVRTSVHTEVSLSDVADDTALLFEPVVFEAGKALEYDIAPEVRVLGDGDKLRRVLSVLLDNAVKYGADGGVVSLTLQKTDRQARLTVSNPGTPIPPEQLGRLFERFYRADASRGEKSGFGLGLSIATAIAGEHRGTLRAESDAESTRFILTLPLKK